MKKLIAIIVLVLSIGIANAQTKEETVYGFCYAYHAENKILYVSDIVSGVINSDTYSDVSRDDLSVQWSEKLRTIVNSSYNLAKVEQGFYGSQSTDSYEKIDEERTKVIGNHKQNGYTINYVHNFSYRKSKR